MPEYSSSSEWTQPSSGPSVHRTRRFEYIPSTGTAPDEAELAGVRASDQADSEVVEAVPVGQEPHGLLKVAAVVAASASSMGGVRKAVGQSVRHVGQIGGAVRQGLGGVPEVDPWRCLIATLAIWSLAVVIARMAIA